MTDEVLDLALRGLQGIALILIAPGIAGLLAYLKSWLQQRQRPFRNVWQSYRDLLKLARKPAVRAETTSWLFALVPSLLFVAYALLAFLVPVFLPTPLIRADLILVIYILGLARFSLSLAGLDAGAPFGGLGGSREMFLQFLTEIGLVLVLAGLALNWGTLRLDMLFEWHWALGAGLFLRPDLLLLGLALAALILFEAGRVPIDNPATHLELTMGGKAITLDYAGRDLALIEWAEMIKLTFLLTLFHGLFVPYVLPPVLIEQARLIEYNLLLGGNYIIKMLFLVLVLAVWESSQPKLRLRKVVGPALVSIVFSLIAIVYVVSVAWGTSL